MGDDDEVLLRSAPGAIANELDRLFSSVMAISILRRLPKAVTPIVTRSFSDRVAKVARSTSFCTNKVTYLSRPRELSSEGRSDQMLVVKRVTKWVGVWSRMLLVFMVIPDVDGKVKGNFHRTADVFRSLIGV